MPVKEAQISKDFAIYAVRSYRLRNRLRCRAVREPSLHYSPIETTLVTSSMEVSPSASMSAA
jgi:hypothetical protein